MSDRGSGKDSSALPTLYGEHIVLGAEFGPGCSVLRYAHEDGQDTRNGGAVLADLTHIDMLLFSGASAEAFGRTAFAGVNLTPGNCAFEAVLTGDGSLASIPLLVRTGVGEYLVLDVSERADILEGWLSFVANIEQNGVAPFSALETDDVSGSHVVLALWGPSARSVLADYVSAQRLPHAGQVVSLTLDAIPAIVIGAPRPLKDLYLILVPPVHAVALWRSFLSFKQVDPVGMASFGEMLRTELPWLHRLDHAGTLKIPKSELRHWSLVRDDMGFIGSRGLSDGKDIA